MADNIYSFADDFDPEEFKDVMRRFREHEKRKEAMKKHPTAETAAGNAAKATENTKATTKKRRLSTETNDFLGLAVFRFFFIVIPLALLFTGIAVVPAVEAIFNTEIGFWTAFFLLMTIRWLILQPRNNIFLWKAYEESR